MFSLFLFFLLLNNCFCFNKTTKNIAISFLNLQLLTSPVLADNINPSNYHNLETTHVQSQNNNIYFYGNLNAESAKSLKDTLNELIMNGKMFATQFNSKAPDINLHIQSYGGSLLDTLYIVDIIKNSPVNINTYIDGYAASAATLISVVGKRRYITPNSIMLIHQLSTGTQGKYHEMEDDMKNNEMLMNLIKNIYYKNTKITQFELDEILKHDIWFDANKCLELGLVDEIIE
tara:strand:+ start:1921 stop:2616 length:696 start_codon:yes stop_codon:yes gene_type:complete